MIRRSTYYLTNFGLETWFSLNDDIRKYLKDMKDSWTKNAFVDVKNKKRSNWCKVVSSFVSNYTYRVPVLTKDNKCPFQVFYFWFVDLHSSCVKYGLETWFSPKDDIRKCLLDIKHGWIKNAFWNVNNKKWRKLCMFVSPSLFNITFRLPVLKMYTKWPSQVFMFDLW
jgi:hypothetical protein